MIDREQQDKYDLQIIANDGKFETAVSVSIGKCGGRNPLYVRWLILFCVFNIIIFL